MTLLVYLLLAGVLPNAILSWEFGRLAGPIRNVYSSLFWFPLVAGFIVAGAMVPVMAFLMRHPYYVRYCRLILSTIALSAAAVTAIDVVFGNPAIFEVSASAVLGDEMVEEHFEHFTDSASGRPDDPAVREQAQRKFEARIISLLKNKGSSATRWAYVVSMAGTTFSLLTVFTAIGLLAVLRLQGEAVIGDQAMFVRSFGIAAVALTVSLVWLSFRIACLAEKQVLYGRHNLTVEALLVPSAYLIAFCYLPVAALQVIERSVRQVIAVATAILGLLATLGLTLSPLLDAKLTIADLFGRDSSPGNFLLIPIFCVLLSLPWLLLVVADAPGEGARAK